MNIKRTLSLLLAFVMVFTCLIPLTSCFGGDDCTHVDSDADGKCDRCGKAVTIDCTAHVDADSNNKCDNCGAALEPAPAGKKTYTVNVKTIGGMPLVGVNVYVYHGEQIVSLPVPTDENGNASFTIDEKTGYTVYLDGVPEGYNVMSGSTEADRYPMGATGAQIMLSSKPVTEGTLKDSYKLGDVMYDFTIKDVNGKNYKLSELLEDKKMVMLNFWYINCSWCNKEFPGLNDSYGNYDDKVEILAVNDYADDSASEVTDFPTTGAYADDNLTFPFFKVTDRSSLTLSKFNSGGYPTSVIIDRYGVICMIESGAIIGESKWDKIFKHFTSDSYTQRLIEKAEDLTPPEKADIPFAGSDAIADAFGSSSELVSEYYPEAGDEYSWPFAPETVGDIKLIRPTNKTDNSYSILYAKVNLKPGQAVMFDYFSSCEYGNDRLVVIVDKDDICSLTGVSDGSISNLADWEQCCAYVDPRPVTATNINDVETYEIAFTYIKDTETSAGDDTVYLKNIRAIDVADIPTETYIIRDAVSDPTPDKSGFNTYIEYELLSDGYYHVKTVDGSVGPLLLVNFLGYTKFDSKKTVSQRIMDDTNEEEFMVGDVNMYKTWMVYATASGNASHYGFSPVTEELKTILDAYCERYRNTVGKADHDDLWLQLCTYYDAYGKDKDGNPTKHIEDPIKGLTTFSAFETDFKENPVKGDTETFTVTYDRVVMPRGYLFKFTPKTSGAYRVTSHSKEEVIGWIFTGSSLEWLDGDGERDVLADFEVEERYCPALNIIDKDGNIVRDNKNVSLITYMEAGKDYYIDIAYYDLYAEGSFTFDITYEGATFNAFVMASPGPVTYIETSTGGMAGLIALGIDYDFKDDGYAYQVLARDDDGAVTKWGEKIYADLYYPTAPFPSQSIMDLVDMGAFDFSISNHDISAIEFLRVIRSVGKNAIITEWIADKIGNEDLWNEKDLDTILELLQKDADVSAYPAEDVATARRALEIGEAERRRAWASDELDLLLESEGEWDNYEMDDALAGNLSSNTSIKAVQEAVLRNVDKLWNETYKLDEVAKGIYHGEAGDMTATVREYIENRDDGSEAVERQGCVAVTRELSEILSKLFSKYVFENVEHDWLKFCYYYDQLGAE